MSLWRLLARLRLRALASCAVKITGRIRVRQTRPILETMPHPNGVVSSRPGYDLRGFKNNREMSLIMYRISRAFSRQSKAYALDRHATASPEQADYGEQHDGPNESDKNAP